MSCSYAAVALARSIFRKGANFTAAIVFQLASTNLVFELGIILIILLGWQFALAEFVGAPIMVAIVVVLFRRFLSDENVRRAKAQAEKGNPGSMEGHAEMDMSVTGGSLWSRVTSPKGFTAISHYFVMDWAAVWRDVAGGLLIAGALAAWLPKGLLEGAVWRQPLDVCAPGGTARRTARGRRLIRLFGRQRAARRRTLEQRHQLRRRDRVHIRGSAL